MRWAIGFFCFLLLVALTQYGASFFGTDFTVRRESKSGKLSENTQRLGFNYEHSFFNEFKSTDNSNLQKLKKSLNRVALSNPENGEWCNLFLDFLLQKKDELTLEQSNSLVDEFFNKNSPRIPVTLKNDFSRWLLTAIPLTQKNQESLASEMKCIEEKLSELRTENAANFPCVERVITDYKAALKIEGQTTDENSEMERFLVQLESQCTLPAADAKNLMNEFLACGDQETTEE